MSKKLLVTLAVGALTLVGMGAGQAMHEGSTSSAGPTPTPEFSGPNADALAEHQAALNEQAATQHAAVVDLRDRIEANARAYEERVQRDLGDRAPTETIPPMATVPPLETDD